MCVPEKFYAQIVDCSLFRQRNERRLCLANHVKSTVEKPQKYPSQTELKKARDDKKFAEDALNKSIEKIHEESSLLNDQHEQVNS